MKDLFKIMTWGENDSNTWKHGLLGVLLMAIIVGANYVLTPEQSALVSVFIVSVVWEYQQVKLRKVKFDLKDVAASCLAGFIVVAALIVINTLN